MRKPQWINPENFADKCAEIFEIYGLEMPDKIYESIHEFIMGFNSCNRVKPPAARSKCERIRILKEDNE